MEPKGSFATSESASVDTTLFDWDPPVGQRADAHQAPSLHPRRRSRSSLRSESNPRDPSPCATREIAGEDCALQRFIVWAAIKRNKSVTAPQDRLKCPLILCGKQFDDHEAMLRHLTKCKHLKTGEYVCHDCTKIERFNDRKCRSCLGHPPKRRRIINMAKKFFSNIGNKSRKEVVSQPTHQNDRVIPPPSYDSLIIDLEEQSGQQQQQPQHEHPHEQGHEPREQQQSLSQNQPQPLIELNGREIHELDSIQKLPTAELDSTNNNGQTVEVPILLNQQNHPTRLSSCPRMDDILIIHEDSQTVHLDQDISMSPPNHISSNSGSRRPSLALDTHIDRYRNVPRTKHLSPSSSLRSTGSSQLSPATLWSASSGGSAVWTVGSAVDTAMTSPATPLSPVDLWAVSHPEEISAMSKTGSACPDDNCNYMADILCELPGDDSQFIPRGLSDPLLFSFSPKDNYSWMQSEGTELSLSTSVNMMFTDTNPKPANMSSGFIESSDHGPDTRTLVESVWGALQEHVLSSFTKLSHIQGNSLVDRLRTQSPKAVAMSGLSSLKSILEGNNPTDPLSYICYIHVIYAFSILVYEGDLDYHCQFMYQQALAYRRFINPAYAESYTQIVTNIWQPTSNNHFRTHIGGSAVGGSLNLKDLENSVIASSSDKPNEVVSSGLASIHFMEFQPVPMHDSAFAITAEFIIRDIISRFPHSEALRSKLEEIKQHVRVGGFTTVRKLELAVLQAGKNSLESSDLFNEFIPQVRRLCDQIYPETGYSRRATYQTLGVSLVEALLQTLAAEPQHAQEESTIFTMEYPGNYNLFGQPEDGTFDDPNGIVNDLFHGLVDTSQQNQPAITPSPSFNSSVDPITLGDIGTSDARRSTTASYTETSNESFVHSPDVPGPTSHPTPPIPSTPVHPEPSPRPGSSSTAQKVEAHDACEICGYRPKGHPQWFKGSMAKHKKMQHSKGPPVIYKCPFPGCNSQYKNRQDNLRQHQIEKNHFVGDETGRRPSKRKKVSTG
ncbi:uncharacterized protein GGS25DRAFT_522347 [Hypoxylon fragiforme]|uniref:uncharacterized protein n=1 Tax=Hypoxylon fragiforme TaxID=63214 RepID=UPI0020C6A5AC|nr:uncharacterized protein GGS25DRAFT_522347 [Hypoxylon fragiforme]KAI2606827.1 hypothetical protein GGS25DRAFT_522347 [Hypoxylon fragiforme]